MFEILENLPYFARSLQMQCPLFLSLQLSWPKASNSNVGPDLDPNSVGISESFFFNLTLCMLGNFSCFCYHLLTFFQN